MFTRLRPETLNADGRGTQAINRVQNLTLGTKRPRFIPTEGGSEAWQELRERLNEPGSAPARPAARSRRRADQARGS